MLVVGSGRHAKLAQVDARAHVALDGMIWAVTDQGIEATGDVLGRVVDTFERDAAGVIDATIQYADGTHTLTGTPNHPFWVDAVRDYVPLGELEVGTVLHVQGGGEAILVSKTWRQGDFAAERSDVGESPERSGGTVRVFDFEVEGLHNFYVRGSGSDAAGVLVHNSTGKKIPNSELLAPPAKRGRAPTGSDGNPVELHHRGQAPDSPLDEMTRTDHRGKGNFKKNHENTGQEPSKIDRKAWKKEREDYWKSESDNGRFDDMQDPD